jgi:DNA replication and repair protein RecF
VVNGKRTHRQLYNVNDNRRRKKDFVGQLLTVVFRPEDMRLIEGSPGRRRDFLNTPLQLTSRNYGHHLSQSEKALRRRNKLLSLIKDGEQSASVLTYWDLSLIKHGEKIQQYRRDLMEFINAQVESPLPMRITYRPSLISQSALDSHKRAAIATGFTLIGPHKDDFLILIDVSAKGGVADGRATSQIRSTNFQSLDAFGSRGQKRLGVLWLKKAELMYLKQQTQQQPVLLLDDILSELDKENRQRVLELIKEEQTIITTAYPALIKEVRAKFTKVDVQDLTALTD